MLTFQTMSRSIYWQCARGFRHLRDAKLHMGTGQQDGKIKEV